MEMKGVAAFTLLLAAVRLSSPCRKADSVLICQNILTDFEPGCSTMLVIKKNIGEINSTVLQSEKLVSITSFSSDNTGITRIAENAFSSFPNLSHLNLDVNMLSEIKPSWFRNPAVLRELRLADNRVDSLNESTLDGLTNLKKLMLNKNRIQTIHPNSFSSQRLLSDLDLSENRLMWVSPQVFRSLSSLRFIRLDKNPWNCSCDAKDFVVSIKELKSRNQLNKSMDVTCETPSLLQGQPVWNVSVCPVDPSAETHTMKSTPSPGKTFTPRPHTTELQHHASLFSATLSSSVRTRPTDAPTASSTGSYVTSPSSGTDSYSPFTPTYAPTPTNPETVFTPPPPDTNHGCTLIAVIAALSVLLFLVCFIALIEIRKRSNKSVMPECPNEEEDGKLEEDSRLSHDQAAGCCENRHTEAVWRSFTGVRAKSAHAVILTSPFCLSEKDKMHFQAETEAPAEVSENPRNKKLLIESGAEKGGRGGILSDHFTPTDTVSGGEKSDDGRNLHENSECVYTNTDTVPYLSIGKAQNKPSPDEESATGPGQRPGKVLRRISTWPPTAAQWEVRCKEEGEGFAVWTQNVTVTLSDHADMTVNKMKHHDSFDLSMKEDEAEKHQMDSDINLEPSDALRQNELKKEMSPDPTAVTSFQISSNKQFRSVESPAHNSSSKTDVSKDVKRSAASRPGAENRKAPSGGTSPDDETLLSGNEYAFMDLLHEVSQNNGRWTRERWKQMHVNKQRRQEAH